VPTPTPEQRLLAGYDPAAPLAAASTPPSGWYTDSAFAALERERVFGRTWQMVARLEQLSNDGDYVAADVAGEPVVVVRDGALRAFYNVCRHHAARVMDGAGCARALHCPYHGWTYDLDGSLRSTPGFAGALDFDRADHGLRPLRVDAWEQWVFVCLDREAPPLADQLGSVGERIARLGIGDLAFHQRVSYQLDCNWKVYMDNYLDGGYHVPFLHRELNGALDTRGYRVESAGRGCVQSCPTSDADSVRGGTTAWYFWLYPNLMINCYQGLMDVNLVLPVSAERSIVHFDYYFSGQPEQFMHDSIAVAHRVQLEDAAICASVQRGLNSRSYDVGRLAPQKESGEHLFHRLLHADLTG
jgi:choline monooxygenase